MAASRPRFVCRPARSDRPREWARDGRDGVALLLGILFAIIASGLVLSGTLILDAHRTKTETNFRLHGQATSFARAGVMEAMGWFRKQSAQPVVEFWPVLDTTASPPILDTIDPEIGIVREFEITGSVWGRYEVWKQWDADPDLTRLAWRKKVQVEDISAERGTSGSGNVWRLRSIGYVFRRVDPTKPFDAHPNQVLGTEILETEIRRLTLAPPGEAAICVARGDRCALTGKVHVQGVSGAGVYYRSGTGSPSASGGAKVSGSPGFSASSSYDGRVETVFGIGIDDLQTLADDRITSLADFPVPVPSNTLYYVEVPTLILDSTRPLKGSAVVFVRGDVDIRFGSKSFFSGLLYVDGDLTIREPADINGTIVCTGRVTIRGGADWVNITYDDGALTALRTEIGQYRLSGAIRSVRAKE